MPVEFARCECETDDLTKIESMKPQGTLPY